MQKKECLGEDKGKGLCDASYVLDLLCAGFLLLTWGKEELYREPFFESAGAENPESHITEMSI